MSMPLKAKANESQGDSIQFTSWGAAEELFRKQKAYFDTDCDEGLRMASRSARPPCPHA